MRSVLRPAIVLALVAWLPLLVGVRLASPISRGPTIQGRAARPSPIALRSRLTVSPAMHGSARRTERRVLPCVLPKQCDTVPPIIIIQPAGGTYASTDSVPITIYYCGWKNLDDTTHFVYYRGQPVTSQFSYARTSGAPCPAGGNGIANHQQSEAVSTGTLYMVDGNNEFSAGIFTPGPDGVQGYTVVYFDFEPRHLISVVANQGATTAAASVSGTTSFTITNLGQRLDTVIVTPTCGGGGTIICITGTDSVHLKPGTDTVLAIGWRTDYGLARVGGRPRPTGGGVIQGVHAFQSPAGGGATPIGSISVVGYVKYNPSIRDSAFTDISPSGVTPIGVAAAANNPDLRVDRDLCLMISVSPGAAYQCGDLRLAHVLPAVHTDGRLRTPTLVYSTQLAHPHPLVNALVTLNTNHGTPDTVVARLSVNSAIVDTIRYTGTNAAAFANAATQRIVLGYDAIANGTSLNGFTFSVSAIYNTAHVDTTYSDTGRVGLVAGQWNRYGAGWMVAGLEGLKNYGSTGLFWYNAIGSYALYLPVSTNVWAAPALDRPDTIKLVTVNSHTYYIRYAEHGNQVWFDGTTLQQTKVLDRLRDSTTFTYYASGAVAGLTVPSPAGGLTYWFNYDSSGYLENVYAPKNGSLQRYVYITQNSSHQVTSIKDPDGSIISFGYSGTYTNVVTARTDERGTTATFGFDAGERLSQVVVDTGTNHLKITTSYTAQETRGLAGPVAPTSAFTTVNGPRTDTTVTKFWNDVAGEPLEIQDANQRWTLITRNNSSYPALVTRIKYPNERVITETYDARGNPATETDSSVSFSGHYPTDTMAFDPKWDYVTHRAQPMGEQWWAQYDTSDGNRLWEQVGPLADSSRRVHYGYNGIRLLASTSVPETNRDSLLYDSTALGNVIAHRTPANYWTYTYRDGIGRDTVDMIPVDSSDHSVTGSGYTRVKHHAAYDIMDRDIADSTFGAGVTISTNKFSGSIPAETLMVWTYYDSVGLVDSVVRRAGPDTNHILSPKTAYVYDRIGRVTTEYAPEAALTVATYYYYDPASNLTHRIDRNGAQVYQTFDPMNRLVQQTSQAEYQPPFSWGGGALLNFPDFPNYGGYYAIYPDTAVFQYDLIGRMRRAANHEAIVARQYDPRGLVLTDSSYIRTYPQLDSGGVFTWHTYGIANMYDADGRRTSLMYPYPILNRVTRYTYDAVTGALASTTGPDSSTVTFSTDSAMRNDSTTYPGGVYERLFFDNGGRVKRRVSTGTASGTFHSDTLWYDAQGRILQADQIHIRTANTYAPLGPMIASETIDSTRPTVPGYTTEAHETDALGNEFATFASAPPPGTLSTLPPSYRTYHYYPYEARAGEVYQACGGFVAPTVADSGYLSDTTYYLSDGSEELVGWVNATRPCLQQSSATYEWRLEIYDGLGKLRVNDMHSNQPSTASAFDFEEFWYDALGRRVFRRSRRASGPGSCEPINNCHSAIVRYVWDGDQLLQEDKNLDTGGDTTSSTLEDEYGFGKWAGFVSYVHAGGIDAPVEVLRYSSDWPGTSYSLFPHANWRGLPDGATYTNGQTTLVSGSDSLTISWPAQSMLQNYQLRYATAEQEWIGGLADQQRDPTGALFMRNRYYDSQTGHFTQEDPLGLGGGLNAYGFAGGDPVDLDDPFGLYIQPISDPEIRKIITHLLQHSEKFKALWYKLAEADSNKVNVSVRFSQNATEEKFIEFVSQNSIGYVGATVDSRTAGVKPEPNGPYITTVFHSYQHGFLDNRKIAHEFGHIGGKAAWRGVPTGINKVCGTPDPDQFSPSFRCVRDTFEDPVVQEDTAH